MFEMKRRGKWKVCGIAKVTEKWTKDIQSGFLPHIPTFYSPINLHSLPVPIFHCPLPLPPPPTFHLHPKNTHTNLDYPPISLD